MTATGIVTLLESCYDVVFNNAALELTRETCCYNMIIRSLFSYPYATFQCCPHPPYLPDLTASNCALFHKIHVVLGQQLRCDWKLPTVDRTWGTNTPMELFASSFRNMYLLVF
ncbi:hypothetical protein NPIL_670031 [Nephila pilipes]|uniref:Uncharacterized protein n=1 Tax=Nephila pilipes TaxID=299642 RepID=A0A8X6R7M3_NEPPI|nr:hypothetical protein NPIL_670031 [Nephila pilipes]